jgi:enamine deaminase RidA (YjgF/YER057c/UK114 family)
VADVIRLNVYTTDFDGLLKHWATLADRFGGSEPRFASSLLGVTRLAAPQLLVMLEATAAD